MALARVLCFLSILPAGPASPAREPLAPAARLDEASEQADFVAGLAAKGLHEMVIQEARAFLGRHAKDPRATDVRYRLGVALQARGEAGPAADELRRVAAASGFEHAPEALFRLAQCERALGRSAAAADALERVLASRADYLAVPATLELADLALEAGDFARAEPRYRAALEASERNDPSAAADALFGLAWCSFRLGRHAETVDWAARFLASRSSDARAGEMWFLRGEALAETGAQKDALDSYRRVTDGPFADAALRGRGFAHAALGEHRAAAEAFGLVRTRYPESRFAAECVLHEGIERLREGDVERALAALDPKLAEGSAEASYWRARALVEAGKPADALATLDRAAAQRRDAEPGANAERGADADLWARISALRGDALSALGRGGEAVQAWQRSGSGRSLYNAAVASLSAGRHADAERLARQAVESGGELAGDARTVLGEALFAQAEYAEAEESFRAVLSAAKDPAARARALLRIGWCRWLAGDPAGAAEPFGEAARSTAPEAREALFMQGRVLLASGDERAGAEALARYAERYRDGPERPEALLRLARVEGERGAARLEALLREHAGSPLAIDARIELAERLTSAEGRQGTTAERARAEALYREVLASAAARPEQIRSARYGLAWCLHDAGAHAEAAAILRELATPPAADDGGDEELRRAACELWLWSECQAEARDSAGDPAGVLAAWKAFAGARPDEMRLAEGARMACARLRGARRFDDADLVIDALERAARGGGAKAAVAVERARLALEQGRADDAERELDRARSLASGDERVAAGIAEASFAVGEARFEAGDDARAAKLYDAAALAGSAVADQALYKGGFARLRADDLAGAERCFAALVRDHPKSELCGEARFLLGEAQFRAGRYADAAATLSELRRTDPRHEVLPKALFRLGQAEGHLERWRECSEALAALLKASPEFENRAEAELWRGRALVQLGDERAARAALAHAVDAGGAIAAQARLALGRLARERGDLDLALSEFLKVALLHSGDEAAEALIESGLVLEAQGARDKAAEQYREVLERRASPELEKRARGELARLGVR